MSPLRLVARATCASLLAVALFALSGGNLAAASRVGAIARLPAIRHVFLIVLENEDFASSFGEPSADPYRAGTLVHEGALLTRYYAIGHYSADNYIALISGQPPNPATQGDCALFSDFDGAALASDGIARGVGCVYPADVETLANQLSAAHLSWKAYMQDMGNLPAREQAACGHPAIGAQDGARVAVPGDGYATRHDPFVYFHSIIDNRPYCDAHVVALGAANGAMPAAALPGETGLADDLSHLAATPNFSFITPNLCSDGHDYPCINQPSGPSPWADVDAFLQTWVPKITSSAAFRLNGLLVITFDESEGPAADSSACCGERPGPAAVLPGESGPGGGLVGAVLLSPFIKGGTVSDRPYNHFSTLATIERLFDLRLLGEARTVTSSFAPNLFTSAATNNDPAPRHASLSPTPPLNECTASPQCDVSRSP